ncbi:MAG: 2-oxoglutarate dehydrogenase E1 component [Pirellulales bacterium]
MSMSLEESVNSSSAGWVEDLYAEYLRDPQTIPTEWRQYFAAWNQGANGFVAGGNGQPDTRPPAVTEASFLASPPSKAEATAASIEDDEPTEADTSTPAGIALRQERIDRLVRAFRVRGHLIARFDPLGRPRREPSELKPAFYGLTEADLDLPCSTQHLKGADVSTVRTVLWRMSNTYCRHIGVQFMHIDDATSRGWLQDRMEGTENRIRLSRDEQLRILRRLADAVILEEFIQKKYLGAKSFSLEGGETLIPLLDLAIEHAGSQGVEEIVLGMAHRGRLNVLANIMRKSPQEIFREFEDVDTEFHRGLIDVKYHLGYSSDWKTREGRNVHLSLCFNPSHLEFVNPVALGRLRAKQDRTGDSQHERGLGILIHGDAAFAGEGVVQETLNLSNLDGYSTGGTLHVIVNNQIGFTTGPDDSRSCIYATDVAKMLQSPIFHVNGEHPEAVAQVVRLALDFRDTFKRDVVIDMYCYRRRGHNEGDEPAFTQPLLYKAIAERMTVWQAYLEHLVLLGEVSSEAAQEVVDERWARLERELSVARSQEFVPRDEAFQGTWRRYVGGPDQDVAEVETGVSRSQATELLSSLVRLPDDFHPHPKIERLLKARQEMALGNAPLDWAAAEALAFASLSADGSRIRLSGQDSERGTFSQRHAVLHDVENGKRYMPLANLSPEQAPVEIYNSPLSEAAVLGFDYGYSLDCPEGLVMWEAQFGDFCNAAQVIIDQFIAAAEDKWRRVSGIVLLLPHGFEGMGPEHSSARLERFLNLAARDNIQVVNPSTPAQYFHVLRRQVMRAWRKPLVVMTPKSLLRNPKCVSTLDDCASGMFRRVLPDTRPEPSRVERVLMCSGKIYYELEKRREELNRDDLAIVRIEQLYPFPHEQLRAALAPYRDGTPVCWVQEEPENMGAWQFLKSKMDDRLFDRFPLSGVVRPAAASPATGSASSHKLEQETLLNTAFGTRLPAS